MSTEPKQTTPALPPGFRVFNDGPGGEVLWDDRCDDPAPVFTTVEEAAAQAWVDWRTIYEPEMERDNG